LSARFPAVAATWHPTANGAKTPDQVAARASVRAVWRCTVGHIWEEVVAARTTLPAWKGGDVAACRICVGYHSIVTFDCGHTAEVKTEFSDPARDCPACRRADYERREAAFQARRQAARDSYEEDKQRAQQLVQTIEVPEDVPVPLGLAWRTAAVGDLRSAVAAERHHGKTGLVGTTTARLRTEARTLLPTDDRIRKAIAAREPLQIAGRGHWPTGWLRHVAAQPLPRATDDEATVAGLRHHLEDAVADAQEWWVGGGSDVAAMTRWLTEHVADWAYGQETKWRNRRWNVFRELSLPVAPGGSSRFGRLDVTIMRPDLPDIVVELDSTHNTGSVAKLEFARDAGAVPVWVRWHSGRLQAPEGVAVIDLIEATRYTSTRT
jgi:hypothetical protein